MRCFEFYVVCAMMMTIGIVRALLPPHSINQPIGRIVGGSFLKTRQFRLCSSRSTISNLSSNSDTSVVTRISTANESNLPFFRVYYNDVYEVNLPPRHRFPMSKYGKVRRLVQQQVADLPAEERNLVNCGT